MDQQSLFIKYNGALLYKGLPHQHQKIDDKSLKRQILRQNALFARYTTDSQLVTPPHSEPSDDVCWWHCLRDAPIDLALLASKQRYRIKKGLKLNEIRRVSGEEFMSHIDELTDMLRESFSDYPEVYKPIGGFREMVVSYAEDGRDKWLVHDKDTSRIVGMSLCALNDDAVELNVVKVNPSFLKNEVNAALVYELCRYYLNEEKMRYICDGERNIMHITNYQDFLVRVLDFRKVPCKLHVLYHPVVRPMVAILYPFRNLLGKIKMRHKLLYKIHSVLMQEQIARKFR